MKTIDQMNVIMKGNMSSFHNTKSGLEKLLSNLFFCHLKTTKLNLKKKKKIYVKGKLQY